MSARLSDYDYELPRELIAQRPPEHRDDSRLMVLRRDSQGIEHRQFDELKTFLQHGDLLVLNDTQVLPARRFSDDGAVEFLFLERLAPCRWKCLVSPGRKMRIGATVKIDNVTLCVDKITPEGERIVVLNKDIDLYSGGSMPLPPYIRRDSNIEDAARYQTVFAHAPGALAAPTAGLHFTSEILNEIPHTFVTLHVGTGTFLPVRSENITEHRMHAERFSISPSAAGRINSAGRIVAVGTTVVRVLESAERTDGNLVASGRFHRYFHLSAISVSGRRRSSNEFSFAAFDFAYAGERVCWPRVFTPRLSGGDSRTLPFLQLRRLHADPVRELWRQASRLQQHAQPHRPYEQIVLLSAPNGRATQRRIGYPNDCHAYGH